MKNVRHVFDKKLAAKQGLKIDPASLYIAGNLSATSLRRAIAGGGLRTAHLLIFLLQLVKNFIFEIFENFADDDDDLHCEILTR